MTNKHQQTFGELMREHLKDSGWTQAELARRVGFSKTYIGNLLQDRAPSTKSGRPKRLPAETVDKIARALKIPLNAARQAAGLAPAVEAPSPPASQLITASGFSVEDLLLHYFRMLPPDVQSSVIAYVGSVYLKHQTPEAAKALEEKMSKQLGLRPGEKLEVLGEVVEG